MNRLQALFEGQLEMYIRKIHPTSRSGTSILSVFFLLLSVGVVLLNITGPVMAAEISDEQRRLFRQQVLYFDIDSYQQCVGGGTLSGSDNEEKIWNFLSDPSKNLKDFQVAGIMGNMVHESGLNPNKAQPSTEKTAEEYVALGWDNMPGHAYGIVQWDRGKKLTDNADPLSKANDVEFQLNFLWNQLLGEGPVPENTKILEQIRSTTNTKDAVLAFQGNLSAGGSYIGFERPADQSGSVPERLAAANLILDAYAGRTASATNPGDTTNCLGSSTPISGLVEATKAYAWPQKHSTPPEYIDRMPAYAQAVTAADKLGIYRGGEVGGVPGIDCGGFVTLLMINSGFEPNYNYGGLAPKAGAIRAAQEPWLKANWDQIQPKSTADMKPGDVAANDSHTYVYVGKIDGFDSLTASASFCSNRSCGRAPMAGWESPADPDYRWYRKKGQ